MVKERISIITVMAVVPISEHRKDLRWYYQSENARNADMRMC